MSQKLARLGVAVALIGEGVAIGLTMPEHSYALAVCSLFAVGMTYVFVQMMFHD